MSSDISVDHPGQMSWFVGRGPAPVLGPCPHGCEHRDIADIAWGPDEDRYVLVQCGSTRHPEDGDCAGQCRAWLTGEQSERGRWQHARWLHVDLESEDRRTLENRFMTIEVTS